MDGKFSKALYSRQHKGVNTIVLIVGARGIGKSYLSLKLGERYDPQFSVDNVTFDIEEFLVRVDVLRHRNWSWLIFDEIGLEVAARDFMSMINKIMSYVSQSFRYTKVNLACVCPDPDMVDLHVRKLSDFWMLVTHRGHARVFKTKMNPFRSGSYYTPLFCELNISLPSDALAERYEEKRHQVLKEKYQDYLSEIARTKSINTDPFVDLLAKARPIYNDLLSKGKEKKAAREFIRQLGVSQWRAYQLLYEVKETAVS
jgi:hypothetical protein